MSVAAATLSHFRALVADDGGPSVDAPYTELHQWSIDEMDRFWRLVWTSAGIVGELGNRIVTTAGEMTGQESDLRDTRFFPDARLNVAENLLAPRSGVSDDDEAVVAVDENGERRSATWSQLRADVAAVAAALTAAGVSVGDRVAAYLPVGIEALVTLIATAAIGAVHTSTSPDFGVDGVVDRFGQIEPLVLVATTGYRYGGTSFDIRERLTEITTRLPSLRTVVIVGGPTRPGEVAWDEWLAPHRASALAYERFAFDHPLYVLYSSGTTGKPKCIVHAGGRVLLKHVQEQQHHCDIRAGDVVTWFTTTGWMMWNWLVSALASGATVVLVDGSPFHPSPARLFELAVSEQLTHLGVSAKFLDSCRKADLDMRALLDGSSVRAIGSTGSPLSVESSAYVYERLKRDVHLASMSGGTDLCGCFVAGVPTLPVYAGELQGAVLGMAVDIVDGDGRPSPVGGAGELVCTRPFPSMPLGFWGDETTVDRHGARYSAAYFDTYPGIWRHGDFITRTAHEGYVIHGRSDTTLNPGGVRIGTAEIYRVVEDVPDVLEALVFGQSWDDDTRIVLLVRLQVGAALDDALLTELRQRIRTRCSPRHVPAVILAVDDLPRTRSNKLVELAVADAANGRPVRNTDAIANPEAIWAIAARPELRR